MTIYLTCHGKISVWRQNYYCSPLKNHLYDVIPFFTVTNTQKYIKNPFVFRNTIFGRKNGSVIHNSRHQTAHSHPFFSVSYFDLHLPMQIAFVVFFRMNATSNGSWCMGIKGEMSGTVCVTFTWDMYIYIWVVYSLCSFCCLFIIVTWWYVWCIEWASGNQEEVQAWLVTLWLFIISCYSLYKTTLGLLCSWFENNPHFHKYSMDFHV